MGKLPWFKFNASDWISSETVMLLSWAQKGIYAHLLAHSWLHPGCSIPKDLESVKRLLPKAKLKDINVVLTKCFQSADESEPWSRQERDESEAKSSPRLMNMRLRSTHSEAIVKSEKARESRKIGILKQKSKTNVERTLNERSPRDTKNVRQMLDVDVDKDKDKEESKDIVEKKNLDIPPYAAIIEDLNSKTGKNFKHNSTATKKLIHARWQEGFRLKDFLTVHINQAMLWLSDDKMKPYLRPITLYGTKFESYLNASSSGGISRAEYIAGICSKPDNVVRGVHRKEAERSGHEILDGKAIEIPGVETGTDE